MESDVVINPVQLIHIHICNTVLSKNATSDRYGFIQSKRYKQKTLPPYIDFRDFLENLRIVNVSVTHSKCLTHSQ